MLTSVHSQTVISELNRLDATLSRASLAIRDELASEEPSLTELLELDNEIATAVQDFLSLGGQLRPGTPGWGEFASKNWNELEGLLDLIAEEGSDIDLALGLDEQLQELVLATTRWQVAVTVNSIRSGRPLRELAVDVGMSIGYLSEIEGGKPRKVGLPSPGMCTKIDNACGTDLTTLVGDARTKINSLEAHARRRRSLPTNPVGQPSTSSEFRLQMVADALGRDKPLLAFVERFIRLPDSARRGIDKLVEELMSSSRPTTPT